ncbi:biogenesis of lysosome-related organelles complex 1 subunit 3 [Anoplophora glabripennis]|uniref:biogenesis of lysosome-related organelles complex 1 subunit 3 n=1 Tax=Anoplophora glabripennis TaxID=217634 RepID=UPI0008756995|nr:biogenesis of lysosome-related organelles complex 1 subunit 3 [Anoplophora glabripennis]
MSKPVVISGEASETDSEDELNTKTLKNVMMQSVQGAMITGEDSESEYENDASIASAVSALNQSNFENKNHEESKYDSLFHQKLKEYNARFHNNLEGFTQNTVNEAGRKLNTIDQQLLRSQLTLQNAVTSLKSLSINSLTVKSKLHSLLSAKFLPNVKVNK